MTMATHQRTNVEGRQKCTLVLDENFSHDRFAKYMTGEGWTVRTRRDDDSPSGRSLEEVWGKDGVAVAVHYLDDRRLLTKALWIRGSDVQAVLADLSPRFGGPTTPELLERVADAETVEERVVALIQLAVGFADSFDPHVLEVFSHFASDEDVRIRGAVVQALLYTEWSEGIPLLTQMASADEAREIRDYAGKVVSHLSKPKDER
jgi:hypothetical protein